MATALYAWAHFLVDMVCAWAMFGRFIPASDGYSQILWYNFCAFALQMPLGTALDVLSRSRKNLPPLFAALGMAVTMLGAFTHPVILGLGNALFHVGGGVGTIREDSAHRWQGKALGIFVAPGALGLYLGKTMEMAIAPVFVIMIMLTISLFFLRQAGESEPLPASSGSVLPLLLGCFLVVVLRSHVGMAATFSWEGGLWCVLAVVLGKMAGGLLAARFGIKGTIAASLPLAAGCYLLGEVPVFGLLALFLFNMTMPVTLYLLVQKMPNLPGFSFGLLTFGLFLGFLPTYWDMGVPLSGTALGAVGSLASLAVLLLALRREECPV